MQESGIISTKDLRVNLRKLLNVSDDEEKRLKDRNDFSFDQIVRNFKSHSNIKGNILFEGFAKDTAHGMFQITEKGKQYLSDNQLDLTYLIGNNFGTIDITDALERIGEKKELLLFENISEGRILERKTKVRERSSQLRAAAIEHFTHNGTIICDCCGFEFNRFYGDYGIHSCIEIHHMTPIFLYEEENINTTIDKALKNLLPVCPNCHRVIHKNRITTDMIDDFKQTIQLKQKVMLYKL